MMENKMTQVFNECGLEEFVKRMEGDHHRYCSWEHCFKAFEEFEDEKFLALHLAFYLASWGMYRGSSALLKKDYSVHIEAIPLLKKYLHLRVTSEFDAKYLADVENCFNELNLYYRGKRVSPTDTLLTKIMLGALGCVPAFDRFFRNGFSDGKTSFAFNVKNLAKIAEYAETHRIQLMAFRDRMRRPVRYPVMKLIDMHFFVSGGGLAEDFAGD